VQRKSEDEKDGDEPSFSFITKQSDFDKIGLVDWGTFCAGSRQQSNILLRGSLSPERRAYELT
jgi:hypothetical protein